MRSTLNRAVTNIICVGHSDRMDKSRTSRTDAADEGRPPRHTSTPKRHRQHHPAGSGAGNMGAHCPGELR